MTNPTSKQQYEGAILQQLVKNAEKLAVIEFDFNQFKPKINKIDGIEQKLNTVEQNLAEVKEDLAEVKKDLAEVKEVVQQIKLLLGWLKWIGGALITIALSLVANFVYSLVT